MAPHAPPAGSFTAVRIDELLPGFRPENELEAAVTREPDLIRGLAWGKPRSGHPEGSVARHVMDLLARLERAGEAGERREMLRFVVLVHDSFKYQVRDWRPKTGENHHAMRARRFAERFTDDERILAVIELHDRPYAIWRRLRRTGAVDERQFEAMIRRVPDPDLFLAFIELDGATEGKTPEPTRWFRSELAARGIAAA